MKKQDLLKKLSGYIPEEYSNAYIKRLSKPYSLKNNLNRGKEKLFMYQYLNGSGSELEKKFWSRHSSSRIAFDLYSCLVNDETTIDFEFEYKLPGINRNKQTGVPNMDVFFQQGDTVYFIESKFTETPDNNYVLPEAYYILDRNYKNSKGKYAKRPYSVEERFRNRNDIAVKFSQFCYKYLNINTNGDWFDYKQEICHLFGIIFYALERADCNVKRIDFKNIVYKFDDYEKLGNDYISKIAKEFIKDAKVMVNDILKISNKKIDFDYSISFTQDVYEKYKNKTAYGLDITIKELMGLNWSELNLS